MWYEDVKACITLDAQVNFLVVVFEIGVDLLLLASLMFGGLRRYPSTARWPTWHALYNQVSMASTPLQRTTIDLVKGDSVVIHRGYGGSADVGYFGSEFE